MVADRALGRPACTPADISTAFLYDHFTPIRADAARGARVLRPRRGEGLRHHREPLGRRHVPINTSGGLLGEAYIHGMNGITEAVRQVRGTSVTRSWGGARARHLGHGRADERDEFVGRILESMGDGARLRAEVDGFQAPGGLQESARSSR